jgi:signal peptide peptidase SppA
MPTDTPEPSAALRRGIRAALRRPVWLDAAAVEGVRSAAAFYRPAAAQGDGSGFKAPATARDGSVAIVGIEGPLAQRAWSCMGLYGGDGYDAIQARVGAALADPEVRAVVLRIDSPGGEVAGNAEAAKAIKAAAAAAGKPLVAYADELAASAAYKLACACAEIVAPPSGFVGSVGTLAVLADRVRANEAAGINVRVVRSGPQKAVPHPDEPLTDAGVAKMQATIDALGRMFAEDVAAARGLTAEGVLALEGACLLAADAHAAGLIDRLGNLTDAVARARALATDRPSAAAPARAAETTPRGQTMKTLLAAMGLAPDATEAEALATWSAKCADLTTKATALAALEAPTGKAGAEAVGVVLGWKGDAGRVAALDAQIAKDKAAAEATERAALLDGAVADGKMPPAERAQYESDDALKALPLASIRSMVATRTAIVARAATTTSTTAGPAATAAGLSDDEHKVAALLGQTPEQFAEGKRQALAAQK